jgi:hypothetical protein
LLSKELWSERANVIGFAVVWALWTLIAGFLYLAGERLLQGSMLCLLSVIFIFAAIQIRQGRVLGGSLAGAGVVAYSVLVLFSTKQDWLESPLRVAFQLLMAAPFFWFALENRKGSTSQLNLLKPTDDR